jgi:hypothetical protein
MSESNSRKFSKGEIGQLITGDVDFTSATVRGHIIPDTNDASDIGSAEYKVRDMYVSDNSLWVGDTHKISIQNGKMKFRKRKTSTVPAGISTAGGNSTAALLHASKGSLELMTSSDWLSYRQTFNPDARITDVFDETDFDDEDDNGVNKWSWNGYAQNNASFSVTVPCDLIGIYHIRAMHTHHAIASYGCLWEGFLAIYPGHSGIQTTVNNHNITSGNGGSWSLSRTTGDLTITKNAGTYGGAGQYSIEVTRG